MLKKYDGTNWNTASYGKYFSGTEQFTNFPLVIRPLDQSVQAYTIKGNTSVSGTPSPQNPVTISGVGEETANLFSGSWELGALNSTTGAEYESDTRLRSGFISLAEGEYTISIEGNAKNVSIYVYDTSDNFISAETMGSYVASPRTFSLVGDRHVRFVFRISNTAVVTTSDITSIMLNEGEEALPFEPYNKYKISIVNGSSPLTPMYVSQPLMKIATTSDNVNSSGEVTRIIARYEITGTEQWRDANNPIENTYCYRFSPTGIIDVGQSIPIDSVCTHFQCGAYYNSNEIGYQHTNDRLYFRVTQSTVESFKQWLADLYAAGTPVTVWYILATPTTESVTAPKLNTTDGTATIDIDTKVKPSEMSLTYNGKHLNKSKKYNGNNWI